MPLEEDHLCDVDADVDDRKANNEPRPIPNVLIQYALALRQENLANEMWSETNELRTGHPYRCHHTLAYC